MAKKNAKAYRIRDSKTGRFASRALYRRQRHKAGRGTGRYKRERIVKHLRVKGPKKLPGARPRAGGGEVGKPIEAASRVRALAGKSVSSLRDYYELEEYEYDEREFETGIDYGEAT